MLPKASALASALLYDPGVLTDSISSRACDQIQLELSGLPLFKQVRASLRNPKDKNYHRFIALRQAATIKMDGRAWYYGPVAMDFTFWAPKGIKECSRSDDADAR
jgi:hypothetical protein